MTTTIPKKTRRPMVEKEDRSATSVMPAVPAIPAMSVQVVKTRLVDLTVIRRSILKIAVVLDLTVMVYRKLCLKLEKKWVN